MALRADGRRALLDSPSGNPRADVRRGGELYAARRGGVRSRRSIHAFDPMVEAFYWTEGLYVAAGRRMGRACRSDSTSDRDGRPFATEASGIGLGGGQSHASARRLF